MSTSMSRPRRCRAHLHLPPPACVRAHGNARPTLTAPDAPRAPSAVNFAKACKAKSAALDAGHINRIFIRANQDKSVAHDVFSMAGLMVGPCPLAKSASAAIGFAPLGPYGAELYYVRTVAGTCAAVPLGQLALGSPFNPPHCMRMRMRMLLTRSMGGAIAGPEEGAEAQGRGQRHAAGRVRRGPHPSRARQVRSISTASHAPCPRPRRTKEREREGERGSGVSIAAACLVCAAPLKRPSHYIIAQTAVRTACPPSFARRPDFAMRPESPRPVRSDRVASVLLCPQVQGTFDRRALPEAVRGEHPEVRFVRRP